MMYIVLFSQDGNQRRIYMLGFGGVDRTGEIGTGKSDQRIGEMEEKRGEWQMKDRKWGLGEGGA